MVIFMPVGLVQYQGLLLALTILHLKCTTTTIISTSSDPQKEIPLPCEKREATNSDLPGLPRTHPQCLCLRLHRWLYLISCFRFRSLLPRSLTISPPFHWKRVTCSLLRWNSTHHSLFAGTFTRLAIFLSGMRCFNAVNGTRVFFGKASNSTSSTASSLPNMMKGTI